MEGSELILRRRGGVPSSYMDRVLVEVDLDPETGEHVARYVPPLCPHTR